MTFVLSEISFPSSYATTERRIVFTTPRLVANIFAIGRESERRLPSHFEVDTL